ncbi:hypothetical protein ABZT49_08965 [Methylobacterium sp. EM32]|uniref:hypothetical protein n=1 Tax=Methylobacterium sp. EM32 TaxID=3163481 RepID=UPI0033BDF2D1
MGLSQAIGAPPDLILTITNSHHGNLVLVGGPRNAERTLWGEAGTYRISLPPGAYVIEASDGTEIATF